MTSPAVASGRSQRRLLVGPRLARAPQHAPNWSPRAADRLGSAAGAAACAAAAALAVVTLREADDDRVPDTGPVSGAYSGLAEHGSIRASEGSVEDDTDR